MRVLSASQLLHVWERGLSQTPMYQALLLLAVACPDLPIDALEKLSVGRRDALLLTLREWLFGPSLAGVTDCPGCGQRLEFTFSVVQIRAALESEVVETLSLSVADYELEFRLPNSQDLIAAGKHQDPASARHVILERCLLAAKRNGVETSAAQLPTDVVDTMAEKMARADPQADVSFALSCRGCRHQWQAGFDIVSFFWSEIHAWAQRILREVHTLASAYGWREADILQMSPSRRQFYLELFGA